MVNHKFARQFFPNGDALGQRLLPLRDPAVPTEIIGVVEDIKEGSLDSETRPTLYYPFAQNADNYFFVFARTSGDSSVLPSIASAIRKIDPEIVTLKGQSMDEQISQSAYIHRSLALLVGGFAGLALLLGVVGLYGVIAYSVSQRTREIGVRIALGAESIGVCRLILKDAGGLITWGLLLGIACSIGAARLMTSLLFEVTSWDIPTLAAVALVLSCSALLASFIPARRASLLNPVEALRAE
jgi:ABC-type antimicrobial peptide transport system permease subunit